MRAAHPRTVTRFFSYVKANNARLLRALIGTLFGYVTIAAITHQLFPHLLHPIPALRAIVGIYHAPLLPQRTNLRAVVPPDVAALSVERDWSSLMILPVKRKSFFVLTAAVGCVILSGLVTGPLFTITKVHKG